jgi:spermidine synthase
MRFDPIDAARHAPTADRFEALALDRLARDVGYDVAFACLRGATPTSVGLPAGHAERAVCPRRPYERELAPVKHVALAARGAAVDTDVLGSTGVGRTAYYRDLVAPLSGAHSLMGYLVLRGRVIGAVMLGRTGAPFRAAEVDRVADLLPSLAVARASYGLPGLVSAPLPAGVAERGARWPWAERVLARRSSGDTDIRVRDRRGQREMVARDRDSGREMVWTRAALDDPTRSGWPYVDLIQVAAGLARRRARALFIGCGGAVGPRQFAACYPGVAIDVVESDAHVVELARAFYSLDEIPGVRVHVADGAAFLRSAPSCSWDVVVVDAYEGDTLGDGMSGRAFFAAVRAALCPGGAMAFNVVGALDGTDPVRSVVDAACAELADVRVVPVMTGSERYDATVLRNVVVVGVREETPADAITG